MNLPHRPIVSAIAAMAENRVIGRANQLPWRLPADLAHFKKLTTGHPIIMGRKTYASIGKPLPNRTNVIVTRDTHFEAAGCLVAHRLEEALQAAADIDQEEIFVIGGAEIYQQSLPYLQRLYLTLIHHAVEGDAFFPPLDDTRWKTIAEEKHDADENNPYAYSFLVLAASSSQDT